LRIQEGNGRKEAHKTQNRTGRLILFVPSAPFCGYSFPLLVRRRRSLILARTFGRTSREIQRHCAHGILTSLPVQPDNLHLIWTVRGTDECLGLIV
jgi:hypothetical protein